MRESLEKMLAKGVDNPLLRFGLGKGLDEGNAKAAVHLAVREQDPKYSAAWKLLGKAICRVTRRAQAWEKGSKRRRPMATSRPRKK
jgi:hypothetical protein